MLRSWLAFVRVVIAERGVKRHAILKADQLPTNKIAIPAVARIAEESEHCVCAKQLEEIGGLDGMYQLDLLRDRERRDAVRVREHFFALLLHASHAGAIALAQIRIESRQRPIDEIDDAR